MNSVFIPLFSIYQTCQTEVKLFQCFAFPLATCIKNQEQSIAWTKIVHYLSWLSQTINILFSSCTFKLDRLTCFWFVIWCLCSCYSGFMCVPPGLTVRAPETLKRQRLADPKSKYFMTLQLHEIKSRQKPFIYIALSKGWKTEGNKRVERGEVGIYESPEL